MSETITSLSNAAVKEIASLKEKKYRKLHGLYIAEGEKMVNEARAAGKTVKTIAAVEKYAGKFACEREIIVGDTVFSKMSAEVSPQGVLAVLEIPKNEPFLLKGNALLLDGIGDPGNLGTIVRTAAAVGIQDIYAVNCADFYSPKAVRSSMSGIYFVRIYSGNYDEIFSLIKGSELIAADMDGTDVFGYRPNRNFCLAVGNEANGLSDEVKKHADKILSVPMQPHSESLNAAVSCSIMMYALTRA